MHQKYQLAVLRTLSSFCLEIYYICSDVSDVVFTIRQRCHPTAAFYVQSSHPNLPVQATDRTCTTLVTL